MDLDDDELWFTKYKRNYVSKDKIREKIKEIKHIRDTEVNAFGREFLNLDRIVNVLNELLKE